MTTWIVLSLAASAGAFGAAVALVLDVRRRLLDEGSPLDAVHREVRRKA